MVNIGRDIYLIIKRKVMKKRLFVKLVCFAAVMSVGVCSIPAQAIGEPQGKEIIETDDDFDCECSFAEIADIIFGETQEPNESEAEPQWGGGGHQSVVATKYGTKLATFLKNMAIAPDNTTYDFAYSMNHGNYLNLNSSSTIKLSDGLEFKVSDSLNLRKNSILHGRGNYVASLRFLYTVAKNLVNNAYYGTKIQILQSAINDSLGSNDVANHTFYGDNKTYCYPDIKWEHYTEDYQYIARVEKSKEFTAEKQRLYLEKFIYLVANTYFTGQNNAYDEVLENYSNASPQFATIVALKIIGIATHLCGDIYAHKTVVPLDTTFTATVVPSTRNNKTIYRGKAHVDNADGTKTYYDFNGLGRWSMKNGIKTLIEKGSTITTQQITQWQNKNTTAGYPDSTAFYNERLSVGATKLVENMYKKFI